MPSTKTYGVAKKGIDPSTSSSERASSVQDSAQAMDKTGAKMHKRSRSGKIRFPLR